MLSAQSLQTPADMPPAQGALDANLVPGIAAPAPALDHSRWVSLLTGKARPHAIHARTLIGFARAVAPHDPDAADAAARAAVAAAVDLGCKSAIHPLCLPASLDNEPALRFGFHLGWWCEREILRLELLGDECATDGAKANAQAQRALWLAEQEANTPCVEQLLEDLRAGKTLDLHQHTLVVNADFDADKLSGTNAYGQDYYGQLTREYLSWWHTQMVAGQNDGLGPPGSDEPGDLDEMSRIDTIIDVHRIVSHVSGWEHGYSCYSFEDSFRRVVLDAWLQGAWPLSDPMCDMDLSAVSFAPHPAESTAAT